MKLPKKYTESLKDLLNDEYEEFINHYKESRTYGLRVNTLKLTPEAFEKIFPYKITKIPWTSDGYYYSGEDDITRSPLYYAGLFYVQEPTAMAPVEILEPESNSYVLDFCSAPGGKTVQIASKLNQTGVIFANDINFNRLKAVIKNIEKYGIKNAVVINNKEEEIAEKFQSYFDFILVDAPCSGEGMFRKDEKMVNSWSLDEVDKYANMQKNLLFNAEMVLKSGGSLLYSTCTFNKKENEDQVSNFIEETGIELIDVKKENGFSEGVGIKEVVRLFPHKLRGEGHFLAKFKKKGIDESFEHIPSATEAPPEFTEFMDKYFVENLRGHFRLYGDKLYMSPVAEDKLVGLNVLRNGWYLGEIKKSRFEPSQSFAMGLSCKEFNNRISFSQSDTNVIKYLKGDTLHYAGENGWYLVCVEGYPLGWAKLSQGVLKNKYAISWRMLT
ncbi:MAG: RsmB/NOP family class I SAM-dependent RNA methyltransferase [Clostridiales bacterium]|nr:RsmB/NOP family class I SAM-dependent RNA methyltransferase [Clostridiales bacterium]